MRARDVGLRWVALGVGLFVGCTPSWSLATDALDRVVLTVSGDSRSVVVAGGGQGNGSPTLLKELSGAAWTTHELSGTETLWWVSSGFAVGERGAIYKLGAAPEKMVSPTSATLFGVWGARADDVWAVGGSPLGNGENDVILHFDGSQWLRWAPPQPVGAAYFKVWGSSRDDVWIVGQHGVCLHFDGMAWSLVSTPVRRTLLTVTGRSATEVWAVGGPPAVLLRWDGQLWTQEELPFPDVSGLTGVAFGPQGDLFVVGLTGTRWRRVGGKWFDDSASPVLGDLHAVWVSPTGEAWAVGGNYIATDPATTRRGIVARYGVGGAPALK